MSKKLLLTVTATCVAAVILMLPLAARAQSSQGGL